MMRALFVFALCVNVIQAGAQDLVLNTGISFHSLSKLKRFQDLYINDALVPLKSTQSFPPFLQYGFSVRSKLGATSKLVGGVTVFSVSTAARSTYADYSGRVNVDQTLYAFGASVSLLYPLTFSGKGKLLVYTNIGYEFSKLKLALDIVVNGNSDKGNDVYKASTPMSDLGLEYQYTINERLFVNLAGGYHIGLEAFLKNSSGRYEKINWTGAKLLFGVGYRLMQGKKT